MQTDSIFLSSKKVEWFFYLSDDEIDDNIEWKSFEEHMKRIIAKKIANELVETAIYGRKLENPSADNWILNMFDGIKYQIEKDGNVLDGSDTNVFTGRDITRKKYVQAKILELSPAQCSVKIIQWDGLKLQSVNGEIK